MNKNTGMKFFCENCGTGVPAKAVMCPKCGRFFSAVRCPQCSHSGRQSEFTGGCPQCGFQTRHTVPQQKVLHKKKTPPIVPLFPVLIVSLICGFIAAVYIYLQL